jgi:hypothetical protein
MMIIIKFILVTLLWLSPLSLIAIEDTQRAARIVLRDPVSEWPAWTFLWPLILATIALLCAIK